MRALVLAFVSCAAMAIPTAVAATPVLVAPGQGKVRALVVGIDHYRNVTQLKGAVADAKDIEKSLRAAGAADVTALTDDEADRATLLHAFDDLVARTERGDLVVVSVAGHGSKEEERVKGSSRDGTDEVFLLVGFDPKTGPGGTEKILNHEFRHYLRALEDRGAQVIFLADTCFGGGLAREITPGAVGISYRQVPRYRLAEDDLKPVSTSADAFLTAFDYKNTTFLAAVDSDTKAPEVVIDGAYRGALSYAMARAIGGAADDKGDGKTTLRELFAYLRKVVYQLSDERQTIVAQESPTRSLDADVVLQFGTQSPAAPVAVAQPVATAETSAVEVPPASEQAVPIAKPLLTVGTTGTRFDALADVKALQTPFKVVSLEADPDIVWDPVGKEAIAAGDKIALNVARADLPGVVDRTAAVRDIKEWVVRAPQAVRLLPDASLHRRGSRVEIEVAETARRHLVLIDVTGSGVVQFIYPTGRTAQPLDRASVRIPFEVREPFGADAVIAITSEQPLDSLRDAMRALDGRKAAGSVSGLVGRLAPADARVGLVGLFTVP